MTQQIGIITNNQYQVFQRDVIMGVREVAAGRGYDLIIDSYAEDVTHPQPITLDYRAVAGALCIADAAPVSLLHEMLAAGVPISLASHYVPGLPVPAVVPDNAAGMIALVHHVVDVCQHHKLVYIRGLEGQRDNEERENAFRREMMRHNLAIPDSHMLRGDFDPTVAAESLRALIETGADFDAVIAADYLMGIAALETLLDAGFDVPQDVAVVGFGDALAAEQAGLTTVSADVVEQGRRAARQLISQIDGLHITGLTVLSVALVVRDTCCPANYRR